MTSSMPWSRENRKLLTDKRLKIGQVGKTGVAINEVETACDVSIAMDASKDYGLTTQQSSDVLEEVQVAIHGWRNEASRLHIPKAEQDMMASAFEL